MPMPDRESQRKYQRDWMRRRRTRWLKKHGPCARCGSTQRLEVDHVDPDRKVDHKVWSWSQERRDAELRKCQVLCQRCHRQKCARECRGEGSKTAKLTESMVREMHHLDRAGWTGMDLSRRFEVSRRQVCRILAGERWAHIHQELHQRRTA